MMHFPHFFLAVCLALGQLLSTSGELVERQGCDTIVCLPSAEDVIEGASNAIQGASDAGTAIFQLGVDALELLKNPTEPSASDVPAPVLQNQAECDASSGLNEDPGSDQTPAFTSSCEVATKQLVFLSNCNDMAQNLVIQETLEEMEITNQKTDGVLVSMKGRCDTVGGAYFILADLTPPQIETIKTTTGVQAVEPDIPLDDGDFSADDGQTDGPEPVMNSDSKKKNRLKKRDNFLKRTNVWNDLRFLSTAPGKIELSKSYVYFSTAGVGVTVFVIDYGLNPNHEYLSNAKISYKYALEATKSQSDPSATSHGTCICSKVLGNTLGVSSGANLAFIKIAKTVSSLMDAFQMVMLMLVDTDLKGEPFRGFSVVNIALQFESTSASPYTLNAIENDIEYLLAAYQAVVVIAAGNVKPGSGRDVIQWPAGLGLTSDAITVGSVEVDPKYVLHVGHPYDTSPRTPAVTVGAPGFGQCARNRLTGKPWQRASGTSLSTAIVSGLAAYFLSVPILGDQLRQAQNIPLAVKNYILGKAIARGNGFFLSTVWNGLDGDNPGDDGQYGWVL